MVVPRSFIASVLIYVYRIQLSAKKKVYSLFLVCLFALFSCHAAGSREIMVKGDNKQEMHSIWCSVMEAAIDAVELKTLSRC